MKTGPLTLQRIYFTAVNIAANPQGKESDLQNIEVEINPTAAASSDDPRRWTVILSVKFTSKGEAIAPYVGQVENLGGFFVAENWPQEEMEKLVFVNASGILYASIREMVSVITGRGVFPSLTLPSCSFLEMFKAREEERKKQIEASSQRPLNLPSASQAGSP